MTYIFRYPPRSDVNFEVSKPKATKYSTDFVSPKNWSLKLEEKL